MKVRSPQDGLSDGDGDGGGEEEEEEEEVTFVTSELSVVEE